MRIAVLTNDDYLYQKIYLATRGSAELKLQRITADTPDVYDVCLYDVGVNAPDGIASQMVSMGADGDAGLQTPFTFAELLNVLSPDSTHNRARLTLGDKCAYLDGERIALTEVEYKLLRVLTEAADFVSRDELLHTVWGDDVDGGVLNVYVHYLREKLERGEKIILSSRKFGYRIDARYLTSEG